MRISIQKTEGGDDNSNDQYLDRLQPWRRSVYFAAGYGVPQGMCFELGYNFNVLGLALTYGIGDYWSSHPEDGMPGIALKLFFLSSQSTAGYVSYMRGAPVSWTSTDSYTLLYFGVITPLTSAFQLRSEV